MGKYRNLVDLAEVAARRAADRIRTHPRPDPASWEVKGQSDFVTDVDRGAERAIVEALRDGAPDSVVMGEELSPGETGGADLVWIVDPLDGTTNYLHGYPAYAVSIAAQRRGELVAGVVLDVDRDLVYRAEAGAGAWCEEVRLAVSPVTDPKLALIGTGFPFKALHHLPRYLREFATILSSTSGIRRAGSAALDLVDVARGRFEGFWELVLAPWDVAAGTLLVREAGGMVTDVEGSEDVVKHGSLIAGNAELHRWLMGVL